jgi:hypothetical protein
MYKQSNRRIKFELSKAIRKSKLRIRITDIKFCTEAA